MPVGVSEKGADALCGIRHSTGTGQWAPHEQPRGLGTHEPRVRLLYLGKAGYDLV